MDARPPSVVLPEVHRPPPSVASVLTTYTLNFGSRDVKDNVYKKLVDKIAERLNDKSTNRKIFNKLVGLGIFDHAELEVFINNKYDTEHEKITRLLWSLMNRVSMDIYKFLVFLCNLDGLEVTSSTIREIIEGEFPDSVMYAKRRKVVRRTQYSSRRLISCNIRGVGSITSLESISKSTLSLEIDNDDKENDSGSKASKRRKQMDENLEDTKEDSQLSQLDNIQDVQHHDLNSPSDAHSVKENILYLPVNQESVLQKAASKNKYARVVSNQGQTSIANQETADQQRRYFGPSRTPGIAKRILMDVESGIHYVSKQMDENHGDTKENYHLSQVNTAQTVQQDDLNRPSDARSAKENNIYLPVNQESISKKTSASKNKYANVLTNQVQTRIPNQEIEYQQDSFSSPKRVPGSATRIWMDTEPQGIQYETKHYTERLNLEKQANGKAVYDAKNISNCTFRSDDAYPPNGGSEIIPFLSIQRKKGNRQSNIAPKAYKLIDEISAEHDDIAEGRSVCEKCYSMMPSKRVIRTAAFGCACIGCVCLYKYCIAPTINKLDTSLASTVATDSSVITAQPTDRAYTTPIYPSQNENITKTVENGVNWFKYKFSRTATSKMKYD